MIGHRANASALAGLRLEKLDDVFRYRRLVGAPAARGILAAHIGHA
jgi:hypothetical protein